MSVQATVGRALGRVASGLYILTVQDGEQREGVLVSWVQQVAFNPPAISVSLAKDRPAAGLIRRSERFALSVLGESDTALVKHFARGGDRTAFEGLKIMQGQSGPPILADALAYLECKLLRTCDFGADHELFIAEVVAGNTLRDGRPFLHHRGNGFHY